MGNFLRDADRHRRGLNQAHHAVALGECQATCKDQQDQDRQRHDSEGTRLSASGQVAEGQSIEKGVEELFHMAPLIGY